MDRRVEVVLDVEPGLVGDLVELALRRGLPEAVIHRAGEVGGVDTVVSLDVPPTDVEADVVIVLPGNDRPNGEVQVHCGGVLFVFPLDDHALSSLLDVLGAITHPR